MKTYEYDRPIPREQPTPAPSLLDAAKAALTRLEVLESKHAQHLSTWGVRRRSDPPEIVALRAAIAAEEARQPERDRMNADAARMISRLAELEAEVAELRAGLEMVNDFEPYVRDEEDKEIRERNEAWIAQARATLAKKGA